MLKPSPYVRVSPVEVQLTDSKFPFAIAYYAGLKFLKQNMAESGRSVDLKIPVFKFIDSVFKMRKENGYNVNNTNLRVKFLTAEEISEEIGKVNNFSIRKRFRSFDDSIDPEKKLKLDGENKILGAENLPEPIVMSLPAVVTNTAPPKKLKFSFKNK